ncbi:MAG: hypothetical protein ABR612_07625 [Chromatocurvus sp.]
MQKTSETRSARSVRNRALILFSLIVVVTLLWVLLLMYTNLPVLVLAIVGLLSLFLLSVATAWMVMAVPRSDGTKPHAGAEHDAG